MTALKHRAAWYGLALATLAACGRREANDTAARADSASRNPAGTVTSAPSDSGAADTTKTTPGATTGAKIDTVRTHHTGSDTTKPKAPVKRVKPTDRGSVTPRTPPATPTASADTGDRTRKTDSASSAGASSAGGQSTSTSAGASAGASAGGVRDPYHQPPRDTVSQAAYTGWKYFNLNCARCHGEDVTGTTIAPHLTESLKEGGPVNHDEYWKVVHGSRAVKGMPNWTGIIPDTTLESIYAYVKGRADGTIHPGRPAVKQ